VNTKRLLLWAGAALLATSSLTAQAIPALYGYSFNIDGTVTDVKLSPFDPIVAAPVGVDISGFSDATGLGTITASITGTGVHAFDAFFDHEIVPDTNTYFNEFASATGVVAAGIYENFQSSLLDNGIGTSIYGDAFAEDDVSMAMGWDFRLDLGETALITLLLSDTDTGGGFFLTHSDADSQYEFYLSSTISIAGGPSTGVPEPSVLLLLGIGLAGMVANNRRKKV